LLSFGAEYFFCLPVCYPKIQRLRYGIILLHVVLYGCETWSLIVRKEHSLRAFENRVLRRTFGPKRYKVTADWRKLHNEELNDLCSAPNIIW